MIKNRIVASSKFYQREVNRQTSQGHFTCLRYCGSLTPCIGYNGQCRPFDGL